VLCCGDRHGFVFADVAFERYQGRDKRDKAQYEDRKQYAHGNQIQDISDQRSAVSVQRSVFG
jgi:hypothetical protein